MSTDPEKPAASSAAEAPGKYIALARRYRPTSFADVIGQDHVTRTLQNAIKVGRVHHAYLFTGSRGIGKTTVARILARALNHPDGPTPTPPPPADPEAESRNAVDVIEIDGASHTGVDDVRELRESARYLPANARHKIYIIDEVHMLSTSAFNALLKTLEEPPPHVIFMFATTEPHKIPATILSRCQRFDFKRVPTATIVGHLQALLQSEAVAVEEAGLQQIARAAEGGVRDALSLLDQVIAYAGETGGQPIPAKQIAEVLGVADRRVLFALSAAILARDPAAALGIIDTLFADGHDLAQFAQAFVTHLRDLVVVASCDKPEPLVEATDSELQALREQAGSVDSGLLQLLFERLAEATEQIARSSFPRLLLEMAVIELAQMEPILPLGDLLERLEGLERRVAAGGAGGGSSAPPRGSHRPPRPEQPAARGAAPAPAPASVKPPAPQPAPARPPAPQPSREAGPRAAQQGQGESPQQAAPQSGEAPVPPAAQTADAQTADAQTADAQTADAQTADAQTADAHTRWRGLLDRLRGPWVGIFAAGRLVSWEGDRVELAFQQGFELVSAQDRGRCESFLKACAEQLGRQITLKVRALTDQEQNAPEIVRQSAIEAREHEQRTRVAELREEALAHPITRKVIDELGAKVVSVVTESEA